MRPTTTRVFRGAAACAVLLTACDQPPLAPHHPTDVSAPSMGLAPLEAGAGGLLVTGPWSGPGPVRTFQGATATETGSFFAFDPAFAGGVRVGTGDLTGDGVADIVAGSGPESEGHVRVFDGVTGAVYNSFLAAPGYVTGIHVAVADVNGDGLADVVTGAGSGAPPEVMAVEGTGGVARAFLAFDLVFAGGVRVAGGDVNGDGYAEMVVATGPGTLAQVKVFDGATGALLRSFLPYAGFSGGVYLASGDVTGDGVADVVTGAGAGGGPHVKVFDGATGAVVSSFFAYDPGFLGGVSVGAGDMDGDGRADIVTGAGPGHTGGHVKLFSGATGAVLASFFAYPGSTGGVMVSATTTPGRGAPTIDGLLTVAGDAVAGGTLVGEGPTPASAAGRLDAWLNMLESAGQLLGSGDTEDACDQLRQAYLRADGTFPPPDFVSGPARQPLADMVQALREALECGE